MAENIRNIGRLRGELDAHFATIENMDVNVRPVQRAQREPIVPPYVGILDKLSSLVGGADFNERNVDETGVSRKLTFMSKITYSLKAKPDDTGITDNKVFEKNAFMHVGMPDIVSASVKYGLSPVYPNPAISEAEFAVAGAYNERSSQRSFANRYSLDRNTYMTAAAMQMAYCYMNHFLMPRLCGGPQGFHIAAIPVSDQKGNPTVQETCLMPAELVTHHKSSVLSLVHYALTANSILGVIDPGNNASRVFNAVGDLDAAEIDEDDFWETWHLLKHSSQGSANSDQWDIDFLLLVIQNFPLHGLSDEGGVWRNLFKKFPVCPNACVITSNFRANTIGYSNIMDRMVIGSAMCLQALISRALYESDVDNTKFMLHPNPSGSDVNMVLQSMREDILSKLFEATMLPVDYWEQYLTTPNFQELGRDRHIRRNEANFLKNFSPFMITYPIGVTGDRLGKNEFISLNPQPLVFSGEYRTDMIELDNSLFVNMSMQRDMVFSDGLLYLNPKINPDNGLMGMINNGTFSGSNSALDEHVPLVDGRMFSYGQSISDVIWTDNRDVIPTTGDLRSVHACTTLLSANGMPSWIMKGDYKVCVGRYFATTAIPKESRGATRTRMSLINAMSGNTYTDPFGSNAPRITDVETYLRTWKKYSITRARNVARSLKAAKERERSKFLSDVGMSGLNSRDVEARLMYDARVRGDQFERAKAFCIKMALMVSEGAYDFDSDALEQWNDVCSSLDNNFSFKFVTNAQVLNNTKNKKVTQLFEYGLSDDAREWSDASMLAEVQSLMSSVEIAMHITRDECVALAMAVDGPMTAEEYNTQISNGLYRASREQLADLKISKVSMSLERLSKGFQALKLNQMPAASGQPVVPTLKEQDIESKPTGVGVDKVAEPVRVVQETVPTPTEDIPKPTDPPAVIKSLPPIASIGVPEGRTSTGGIVFGTKIDDKKLPVTSVVEKTAAQWFAEQKAKGNVVSGTGVSGTDSVKAMQTQNPTQGEVSGESTTPPSQL